MAEKVVKKINKEVAEPKVKTEEITQTQEAEAIKEEVVEDKADVAEVGSKEEKKDTDIQNTFRVGDIVKVFYKIIEGGKERVQPYEGTVISKRGEGICKTFIVRRIGIGGVGVERIFPMYSPKITQLKVLRKGKARRAKLFYLRKALSKKDSRIKERA